MYKYGGKLRVSKELLCELLKIEGEVVHIESDPLTRTFNFYIAGDEKHFPKLTEGSEPPVVDLEVTVKNNIVVATNIVATNIIDRDTGIKYPHLREEEKSNGKEDSKKERDCEHCFTGYNQVSNSELKEKSCFKSKGCKHWRVRPIGVNNGYERNFCEIHPQGECPRQKGDCITCQYKDK